MGRPPKRVRPPERKGRTHMSGKWYGRDTDLLQGPLFPSILRYSIPLMIGSLIQVLFNAVDLAVLGNMADKNAVASVGATGAIVGLLVNSFVGISGGSSVVLARYMGERNREKVHRASDTAMVASLVLGVIVAAAAMALADPMLRLTNCPSNCYEGAKLYLLIYFAGIPAIMVYNFGASVIRTGGNSRDPLIYLVICGVLNLFLNVLLCLVLSQKVIAVAAATVVSQLLGAVLVTGKLMRADADYKLNLRRLGFDARILGKILQHGIPVGFSNALYSISNLQIQSSLNAYGTDLIAGNSAASNLDLFTSAFTNAAANSSFAFVGQNLGAGNRKRVQQSILICAVLGISVGTVLGVGLYLCGKPALSLFIPGEEVAIEYGMIRMKYVLAFYGVAAANQVLTAVMQAFGYSLVTTVLNVFGVLVFRIIWMTWIYPLHKTAEQIFLCYSVSWILCMVMLAVAFVIVYQRYRMGKLKKL